jgi:MYXO-CTERM domain-containing protein
MSLSFIFLLSIFVKPALAVECTVDAVCDTITDSTCEIFSEKELVHGCELDLSIYDVEVTEGGAILTQSTSAEETTILCNSLLTENGSPLTASCTDHDHCGNITIRSATFVELQGLVDLTGGITGGTLTITAEESVTLGGPRLKVHGRTGAGVGGNLIVNSRNAINTDTLVMAGSRTSAASDEVEFTGPANGGNIHLIAATTISVDDHLTTSGLTPGEILLEAGGDINISAELLNETLNGGFSAGRIRVHGQAVTISNTVRAQKKVATSHIDGGQVWISSRGDATLNSDIEVEGGPFNRGGTVRIDALGDLVLNGKIKTGADSEVSGDSNGGNVQISSGAGILVSKKIAAAGNENDGRIDILGYGSIQFDGTISMNPLLDTAHSTNGQIRIESRTGQVTISNNIAASGYATSDTSDKENGIFVDGCDLHFGAAITISAPDGANHLISRSIWNLLASVTLQADAGQGNHLYGPNAADPLFSDESTPTPITHEDVFTDCEGREPYDIDGDGHLDARLVAGGTDCNDRDASIHPDATDYEDDGVDSDCSCLATNTYLPYIGDPFPPGCDGAAVLDTGEPPVIDTGEPPVIEDSGAPSSPEASDTGAELLVSNKGEGISGCGCSTPSSHSNPWWLAPLALLALVRRRD